MSNIATAALAAISETITPEALEYERILKALSSKANFDRYPSDNKFHRQGKGFKSQKRRSNNRKRSK
jgi:hypothetical protein